MKKFSNFLGLIALVFSLSGCVTMEWRNIHPEWNPPKGQEEADAKCKAQSNVFVGMLDAINHTPENVYRGCMASYGYERRRVTDN